MASEVVRNFTTKADADKGFDLQKRLRRLTKERVAELMQKFSSEDDTMVLTVKASKPELLIPHFLTKWLGMTITYDRVFIVLRQNQPSGTAIVLSQHGHKSSLPLDKMCKTISIMTDKGSLGVTLSNFTNLHSVLCNNASEFCPPTQQQINSKTFVPKISPVSMASRTPTPSAETNFGNVSDEYSHKLSLITISATHNHILKGPITEFLSMKRLRPVLKIWATCLYHPNVKYSTLCTQISALLDSSKLTINQFFIGGEQSKLSVPAGYCYVVLDGHNWWPKSNNSEPYRHGVTFSTVQSIMDDLAKNRILIFSEAANDYLPSGMKLENLSHMLWKILARKEVPQNSVQKPKPQPPVSVAKPNVPVVVQPLVQPLVKPPAQSSVQSVVQAAVEEPEEPLPLSSKTLKNKKKRANRAARLEALIQDTTSLTVSDNIRSLKPESDVARFDGSSVTTGEGFDSIVQRLPCFGHSLSGDSERSQDADNEGPDSLDSQDGSQLSKLPCTTLSGSTSRSCPDEFDEKTATNQRKRIRRISSDDDSDESTPSEASKSVPKLIADQEADICSSTQPLAYQEQELIFDPKRKYDLKNADDREQLQVLLAKKLNQEEEKMHLIGHHLKRLRNMGNTVLAIDFMPLKMNLYALNAVFDVQLQPDNVVACKSPDGKSLMARIVVSDTGTCKKLEERKPLTTVGIKMKIVRSDMKNLEKFLSKHVSRVDPDFCA